jgi:hypothetical protein
MSENINEKMVSLKGFTFDGNTQRSLRDLYDAVNAIGCTRDVPFTQPSWREGIETPVAINSYLDPEGQRIHVVWGSDGSGLSRVIDVVLNAPSLACEKTENSCNSCGCGCGQDLMGKIPSDD